MAGMMSPYRYHESVQTAILWVKQMMAMNSAKIFGVRTVGLIIVGVV